METIFSLVSLVIAITIHEFSHAFVADQLGDPTPRSQGRLSLNPLHHLDLLGSLMLLVANFGWGKPVQIDPYNFRSPRRDELLVSLAGPGSNFFLAIVISLILRLFPGSPFIFPLFILMTTNLFLGLFNLLPLPPLDGSKIVLNLLPFHLAEEWEEPLNQYGPFVLALLVILPANGSHLINFILNPPFLFCLHFLIP